MPTGLRRGPTNWQDVTLRCRQRSHGTAKQQARGLKITPVGKVGFVGLDRLTSEGSLTWNLNLDIWLAVHHSITSFIITNLIHKFLVHSHKLH